MPLYKKKRSTKKPRMARRRRQFRGYRSRRPNTNTSQVFSETYKCGTECLGVNSSGEIIIPAGAQGQGFKLLTQLKNIPQVNSYSSLYSAYKIIKAKFTIVPKWTGENYNEAALGTAAAVGILETPRIAYAINDMDQNVTVAPVSELQVLQDNGCRLKSFTKLMKLNIKPKPVLEQVSLVVPGLTGVNTYQNRGQWIEFDDAGPNVLHIGVDG